MKTFPNQQTVTIFQLPRDKTHFYGMFNKAALTKARKELGGSAFKIWTYINENANGYVFALSQVDVEEKTDVKKTAYHSAKKELIEKGYLVETEGSNKLNFYEAGRSSENELSDAKTVRKTNSKAEMRTTPVQKTNSEVQKTNSKSSEKELPSSENELSSSENGREILHNYNIQKETYIHGETNEMDVSFKNAKEARNHYISIYGETAIEEALDLGQKLRDFSPIMTYFTIATLGELPQKDSFKNFVIDNDKLSTFINPEAPQLESAAAPAPRATSPTKDEYKAKIDIKLHSLVGGQSYDELQKSVADLHTEHNKSYYEIFRLLNSGNDKGFKQHGIGSLFNPESYTCKKIAKELAAEQRLQQNIASAAIANSQQPKPKTYTYEVTPDDLGNRNNKKSTSSPVDDLFAEEE